MNQKKLWVAIALVLTAAMLAACGPEIVEPTPAPTPTGGLTIVTPPAPSATPVIANTVAPTLAPTATPSFTAADPGNVDSPIEVSPSYEETLKKADIVLMGKFVKYLRDDNALRDAKDFSKPNTNYMVGVKVYLFQVESVLKGTVKLKQVEVALEYCEQDLKNKKPSVPNANFMEPDFTSTVMMPLFYDEDVKWYINDQGIEPQRFVLQDDGTVAYQSLHEDTKKTWDKILPITLKDFKTASTKK